jgi:hypothetical protein
VNLGVIDWTQVLVALIAGLPAILATVFAFLIHRAIRTPSGDRIGKVVERTHELSAADVMMTEQIHGKVMHRDSLTQPPARERKGD